MMSSSVPTKRISRIFDIGDLRSGHFCDLPIIPRPAGPLDFPPPAGGGGVQTPPPPPQQAVENPEAQQGAG